MKDIVVASYRVTRLPENKILPAESFGELAIGED